MYSCIVLYFAPGIWLNKNELNLLEPRGGGVLPHMYRIGMCRCEGYGFQVACVAGGIVLGEGDLAAEPLYCAG